jgi:hypothetical protein
MGKKALRKRIRTLNDRILEHELKIERELAKPVPNHQRIEHWQKEIQAFRLGIAKAKRHLERG